MIEDFGREVETRRQRLRWSRRELEVKSGVSESYISRLERGGGHVVGRGKVIDLAYALEAAGAWTVDEALATVGEPPWSDEEKALFASPSDPREQLDAMWGDLTPAGKTLLVHVAATLLDPDLRLPTLDVPLADPKVRGFPGRRKRRR